jgi:hypothetical protein
MSAGLDWDLSPSDRQSVVALVRDLGEAKAGERLGLARQTVVRIAAGLPVRRGTAVQVRMALGTLPVEVKR